MASPESDSDEPLTPAGRLFLQPQMNQIINCIIGFKHPINITAIKTELSNSIIIQHPRLSSLLIRDRYGVEHWRKTQVDIDRHVIAVDHVTSVGDSESVANGYLADLTVSAPLNTEKPLWEFHLLMEQNCAILRIHHAVGDGISLMSLFVACCRKADDAAAMPTMGLQSRRKSEGVRRREWWKVAAEFAIMLWFNLVFLVEFVLRALWVSDQRTAVSGGDGVELWPRKLATAKFWIDDLKVVKKSVANLTMNDALLGVISCGLSRYLDHRSKDVKEGLQITGVAMVNLRQQQGLQDISKLTKSNSSGSRWGNQFGMVLLPVYFHKDGSDPLLHLKGAKLMLDRKKKSLEAYFSYRIGGLVMTCFGPKFASFLNYRMVCRTSFTFSNVFGPQEEITFAGNPITYLRVTSSALSHSLTMHVVSYAGKADMQILVAKDIIPDPEFLAKCFEDALLEMKNAAIAVAPRI